MSRRFLGVHQSTENGCVTFSAEIHRDGQAPTHMDRGSLSQGIERLEEHYRPNGALAGQAMAPETRQQIEQYRQAISAIDEAQQRYERENPGGNCGPAAVSALEPERRTQVAGHFPAPTA